MSENENEKLTGEPLEAALKQIRDQDLVNEVKSRDLLGEFHGDLKEGGWTSTDEECDCTGGEWDYDHQAEKAYLAMHREDWETVRKFVLQAAGRVV